MMQLIIERGSLAKDVKKIFANCYPYLKIEFYKKPVNSNQSAVKKEAIPLHKPLIQLVNAGKKTVIDISRNVTVAALENKFASVGLMAEVFRKSGNVWVETSLTSNWTLHQQNAEAEEISRAF